LVSSNNVNVAFSELPEVGTKNVSPNDAVQNCTLVDVLGQYALETCSLGKYIFCRLEKKLCFFLQRPNILTAVVFPSVGPSEC
jgi:hypothetical protein